MAQMNNNTEKLVNITWASKKSNEPFSKDCSLEVALWHCHDLKNYGYEPMIRVNGIIMPDVEVDETFFYASVEAAMDGRIWCEGIHNFVTPEWASRFESDCFDFEPGEYEEVLLDNIYIDILGYDSSTGGDDYAIVRDKDIAHICEEDGWVVTQHGDESSIDEDGNPRIWWEVREDKSTEYCYEDECETISDDIDWHEEETEYSLLTPVFHAYWDKIDEVGSLYLGVPSIKYGGWKVKSFAKVYTLKDLEDIIHILQSDPDQVRIENGEIIFEAIDEKEHLISLAETQGWNFTNHDEISVNGEHNLEYIVGDEDDVNSYIVQIDPITGKSRNKGFGNGCFWTEWM